MSETVFLQSYNICRRSDLGALSVAAVDSLVGQTQRVKSIQSCQRLYGYLKTLGSFEKLMVILKS